jgi:hypothetical protein
MVLKKICKAKAPEPKKRRFFSGALMKTGGSF